MAEEKGEELVSAAWVTFETMRMRDKAYEVLHLSVLDRILSFICCCCSSVKDPRKFEGVVLEAGSAPQPENIIWDNLYLSRFSKTARRSISFVITVFFIGLMLVLTIWVKKLN